MVTTVVVLAVVWTLYAKGQASARMVGLVTVAVILPDLVALTLFVRGAAVSRRQVRNQAAARTAEAHSGAIGFWRRVDRFFRTEDVRWQECLDAEGEVLITQPWGWNLIVLAASTAMTGFFTWVVVADPKPLDVSALVLLVFAAPTALIAWMTFGYRNSIFVTQEGVSFRRGPMVPFSELSDIRARLGNAYVTRPAYVGEWLPPWLRKSGRKMMVFNSHTLNANPYALADWLEALRSEAART